MNSPRNTSTALRAAATGTAPAPQQGANILQLLDTPKVKSALIAVSGKFMTPDRMLRLLVNCAKKTPKLMQCDPQSVLGAMMTTCALGLEPNTPQQLAFLIPYERRQKRGDQWISVLECQFQVGARGYVTLAYRSPLVSLVEAGCVHQGDTFEHQVGSDAFLRHSVSLQGRGEPIGAFSYIEYERGPIRTRSAVVLPVDEIEKIRGKSEAWRNATAGLARAQADGKPYDIAKAQKTLDETPWVMWFDDMATKSAIKKHAKRWPIAASELAAAANVDGENDRGQVVDMAEMTDPDRVRGVLQGIDDAPLQLDNESAGEPISGETFGTRERQPVQQQHASAEEAQQQQQAAPAPRQRRARPAAEQQQAEPPAPPPEAGPPPPDQRMTVASLQRWIRESKTDDDRAMALDQARSDYGIDSAEYADVLKTYRECTDGQ